MNLINRKPRKIADAPKDYRPPAARVADDVIERLCDPLLEPRRIPITEAESEVKPCTCHPDDNPPVPCARKYAFSECVAAAAKADRLAEIATLIRQLTYGEMIELAAAIWKARLPVLNPTSDNPNPQITAEALPGILHKWSACLKAKENSE